MPYETEMSISLHRKCIVFFRGQKYVLSGEFNNYCPRSTAARIQRVGDLMQGRCARAPYLANAA